MIRSASFNTSSQPPAKQPFSFGGFGSTNNSGAASGSTGTTFGAPATNSGTTTSQPGQSGGTTGFSFGAPAAQPAQASTSTFGFGSTNTAQAGATGTGAGSSLFGNNAAKPGGLTFGQPSEQQQPQQTAAGTGGLFGNTSSGGLFGGGASAQPAATSGTAGGSGGLNLGGSLFGASTNNAGTSAFGQTQGQQQQQQPSALLRHPFYQKERYNDLNEEARSLLTEMDKMITSQINLRDELKPKLIPAASSSQDNGSSVSLTPLGRQISSLYQTLRYTDGALSSLNSSLESELANVRSLSNLVERDRQDFVVLWEIGSAFREGRAGAGENRREWIREYFAKAAEDFRSKIIRYSSSMEQIERHLASLSSRENHSPQAISDTIFFQHSTFMSLASQVANLHAEVEVLKRDYRDWYARQFRSVRDPFELQGMSGALEMSQGF